MLTAIVSYSAIVWPFVIYWLVFFVACYAASEVGQDFFYDEVNRNVASRSLAGSLILAALATWLRPSFDTLFTANVAWTALQGIAWIGVFMFILEFHPWHALGLGLAIMLTVTGLATMGVESLTKPGPKLAPVKSRPDNTPQRKSLSAVPPVPAAKGARRVP